MKLVHSTIIIYLLWLASSAASAADWMKIDSKYIGAGKWQLNLGGGDVVSSTPGLKGFLFRLRTHGSSVVLVQEDFDDGTRYRIFENRKAGLLNRYELGDMQSVWKELPSGRGDALLFVTTASDYDSVKDVIAEPDLFVVIAWRDSTNIARLKCGLRSGSQRNLASGTRMTSGERLIASVRSISDLSCSRAK